MSMNEDGRRCVVVIPARYGSSRLPGKPLAEIAGLPMVEHTRRRALQAKGVDSVVVATDDNRIEDGVCGFGAKVVRTGVCVSGTHRVAETLQRMSEPFDFVINLQVDMPGVQPEALSQVVEMLRSGASVATLAVPIGDPARAEDPHLVKVVVGQNNQALYFSRCPIPRKGPWLRHLGIYGFTREALFQCTTLPRCAMEVSEDLEQLRWLSGGVGIRVGFVGQSESSVDTRDQLEAIRNRFSSG